jgi:hypothetical protein
MKFSSCKFARLFLLFVVTLLTGCIPFSSSPITQPASVSWHQGYLRAIDPVDSSAYNADMLAVFSQWKKEYFYLRLDFLNSFGTDGNITVILWDIPTSPNPTYDLKRVLHFSFATSDSHFDILSVDNREITVSLFENKSDWLSFQITGLDPNTIDQVSIQVSEKAKVVDHIDHVDLRAVAQPANVFLSFYNTLPAGTPAQVLRRWDGAHTGPIGSRHGLRYLLENADEYSIPITIVDLKQTQSLYALSMLGQTDYIHDLVEKQLLFLPDVASGNMYTQAFTLLENKKEGLKFGIPSSNAVYGVLSKTFTGYDTYFYGSKNDQSVIYATAAYRIIPVPFLDQSKIITESGLTTSAIAILAEIGSSESSADLLIMGGDFPKTLWGDPIAVKKAFEYISIHPWIKPLSLFNLETYPSLPISRYTEKCSNLLCISDVQSESTNDQQEIWQNNVYAQLLKLPSNSITTAAWDTFSMLTSPTDNTSLVTLRSQYQGTLDALLFAANWAANPLPMQTCTESSTQALCFFANKNILAILSSIDGRILMLFSNFDGKVTQWIAPYSQKMIGLSDSTMWNYAAGTASDPSLIEGAFIETTKPDVIYQIDWVENQIIFSSPDDGKKKKYVIKDDQLVVVLDAYVSSSYSIPVFGNIEQNDGVIIIKEETTCNDPSKMVVYLYDSTITITSFSDSQDLLEESENPSHAYPAGHYLPIPFSLINLENNGPFSVEFTFVH